MYNAEHYHNNFQKDINYLKDFKFNSCIQNKDNFIWRFVYKTNNGEYKILCCVIRDKGGKWHFKSSVFWKNITDKNTNADGRDVEFKILNCKDYSDFKDKCNLKLKNNLILDPHMYDDDYNFSMDKQIIHYLIILLEKYNDIENLVNFKYYDDLKKIYKDIVNKSNEEILDYVQEKYPNDTDKQFILLKLDTLKDVDNFISMKKMGLMPKI